MSNLRRVWIWILCAGALSGCLAKKNRQEDVYFTADKGYSSRMKKCQDAKDTWVKDHCVQKSSGKTYGELCMEQDKKWDPATGECLDQASSYILQTAYSKQKDCEAAGFIWMSVCVEKKN